ncbi:Wzz/FepE/Etk N-terminal domain-containing protein [Sulfuricurvum sp.]|uniref:Wzz/FepE/Etk N-terminal domain-containing protein n=1 Tax=Sulfuricurvum sp. TaxID=2025608 RepID=UPI00198961EB|nr:Wzz/FepE/Etk N-terminal domain-containing protein [Sulfuricurvum sp.]MBD3799589.1 hypothetical protein [Campylobacterota bacterium]MBD3806936.1 hypothetical protein [Sulfuricurvum sp.]
MNDQPTNIINDDEIDLRELAQTILRHKGKLTLFVIIITLLSVVWSLSKPNIYHSQVVLVPQEKSKSLGALGGLGALAGVAGVDIGDGEMQPDQAFTLYADDYSWMRKFLVETKLFEKLNSATADQNYRFAAGYDGFYRMFSFSSDARLDNATPIEREKILFETYQRLRANLVIESDKKTSVITIGYSDPDPVLAKEVVEQFLTYASRSLREYELRDMDKKIAYYSDELHKSDDLSLKTQLSQLMSAVIQKKVLAQSSDLYNVKIVVQPSVAYERDKEGPKRGLIVVVSMVTSLIVGIFAIFMIEFIRTPNREENQ